MFIEAVCSNIKDQDRSERGSTPAASMESAAAPMKSSAAATMAPSTHAAGAAVARHPAVARASEITESTVIFEPVGGVLVIPTVIVHGIVVKRINGGGMIAP
jgi:hypothetical protein